MDKNSPNILIVYVDQMRADCFGAAGHPDLKTPNLDRIAEQGVLFEQAYSCAPICTPSRGAFMTGRYGHANGACSSHKAIEANPVFLGQIFHEAGYRTCYIGKMHLAGAFMPGFVARKYRCGFQEFVGFNHSNTYYNSVHFRDTPEPIHEPGYEPDIQTDLTLEFLQRPHKNPFLLMLSIGGAS